MTIRQEFGIEDELTTFTCFNVLSAGSSLSILDELPDFEDDDDDANSAPLPPSSPMPSPAPVPVPSWAFAAAEPMDCRDAVRARYLAQVERANRVAGHLPRQPSAERAKLAPAPAPAPAGKSRTLPESERKYVDHAATLPLWEGATDNLVIGLVAIAALVGVNASTVQFHIHRYHSLAAYRVPYRRGRWATAILKDDVPMLLDAIQTAKVRADTARQRWRRGAVSAR